MYVQLRIPVGEVAAQEFFVAATSSIRITPAAVQLTAVEHGYCTC